LSYQSFSGVAGGSDSPQKLAALKLPGDMTGMRVLDLGCNEGFFSIEAAKRGAEKVIGIDLSEHFFAKAKERAAAFSNIEFRNTQMYDLPEGEFDLIFLFSALHYISTPALLFRLLRTKLKTDGKLILEAGVSLTPGRTVVRALRSVDDRYFPSLDMLTNEWLDGFSVRMIGESVRQAGDPISRYVFHCTAEKVSVAFVVGDGGIGKTSLLRHFQNSSIISVDELLNPVRVRDHLKAEYQTRFDESLNTTNSIWATWDMLKSDEKLKAYFAKVISDAIRQCSSDRGVVLVEGFILKDLTSEISKLLGGNFRCWILKKDLPEPSPIWAENRSSFNLMIEHYYKNQLTAAE
jgi:SAM-dependent methyltransferase